MNLLGNFPLKVVTMRKESYKVQKIKRKKKSDGFPKRFRATQRVNINGITLSLSYGLPHILFCEIEIRYGKYLLALHIAVQN